jgi:hypothetical protein
MRHSRWFVTTALALLLASFPAAAAGPVDGEVTVYYWLSETDLDGVQADSGAPGGRASLWMQRLGVSGAVFRPDPESPLEPLERDDLQLDVQWRIVNVTENNWLALGAGWQAVEFAEGGEAETSGVRLTAEGRVGYLPDLDDLVLQGTSLTGGKGHEVEVGVQLKPFPFVQFFAGFRQRQMTFDLPASGGETEIEDSGFFAAAGVNF